MAVTDGSPTRTGWKRRSKAGSCACCFYLWGGGGRGEAVVWLVVRQEGRDGTTHRSNINAQGPTASSIYAKPQQTQKVHAPPPIISRSSLTFSTCCRYSLSVVAPMQRSSPRASMGLRRLAASIAPDVAPAPSTCWLMGGGMVVVVVNGGETRGEEGGRSRPID